MGVLPVFHTQRLLLKILDGSGADAVLDYYLRNQGFHQPWFAYRDETVFTPKQQQINLKQEYLDFQAGRAVPFWLFAKNDPQRIIGRMAFSHIVHGCFRSAIASWHLDRHVTGQGYAFEAGEQAIRLMFTDFRLHRLEANIMPANQPSISLAHRLGFELAGYEKRYLEINKIWQDHLHYVRLADGPLHRNTGFSDQAAFPYESFHMENERISLRLPGYEDIPALIAYHERNVDHLGRYNPALTPAAFHAGYWQEQITRVRMGWLSGGPISLGLFLTDRPDRLIGLTDLSEIKGSPYNSCELGFSLDQELTGQGLMLESLSMLLNWLFSQLGLQRISAHYLPENAKSAKLLKTLGFEREGIRLNALGPVDDRQNLVCVSLQAPVFHQT